MNRREYLKRTMLLGAAGLLQPVGRLYAAEAEYTGRLLVVLQAEGAWDVTDYCDPKVNQPGEQEITHWSRTLEPGTAGGLGYAPIVNNAFLFDKYHQDMLVINGVDAQTNSHTTGVLHSWSGRNAQGYPSLTALFAAHHAPLKPLSYINFGGFSDTAGTIRFSRLDDVGALRQLLDPALQPGDSSVRLRRAEDLDRIAAYRAARNTRLLARDDLLARERDNLEAYEAALASGSELSSFASFVPADEAILPDVDVNGQATSSLPRQIQMTLAAFEAGVAVASDLIVGGFDTHQDHDALQEPLLEHLNDGIDQLWTGAEAAGFADRLTVVIGSDFGRTPHYNADDGKDHWPIGSVVVMEKNASWTDRAVGVTDAGHNAVSIDPTTLAESASGTIIYPKHVHKALRRHLGIEGSVVEMPFAFANTEDFTFFEA